MRTHFAAVSLTSTLKHRQIVVHVPIASSVAAQANVTTRNPVKLFLILLVTCTCLSDSATQTKDPEQFCLIVLERRCLRLFPSVSPNPYRYRGPNYYRIKNLQDHSDHQLSNPTPVSLHFNQSGRSINHFLLIPLELIRSKRDSVRKAREALIFNQQS